MGNINWTSEMLNAFRASFPYVTNPEMARRFGISESSVKSKARELGLKKARLRADHNTMAIIKEHFENCSFSELANLTGKSKTQVVRIAKAMGLKRVPGTNSYIRSRVRIKIIKRERLRMRLGFAPLTRIKLLADY